jgi:hypothetical protein
MEPIELERAGWRALAASSAEARAFYDRVLADACTMVLPMDTLLRDRAHILDSLSGAPWSEYELTDEQLVRASDDVAAVIYQVRARRGDTSYRAWCTSMYRRERAGWRLWLHQQTPL